MQLAQRKYRTLFVVLIALVVFFPLLRTTTATRIIFDVLIALVFLVSILGIFTDRRPRIAAVLLAVPTLIGALTGYLLPGVPRVPLAVGFHSLSAVFFGFTIGVILWNLHHETGVSADSVYGAFCGYLLAGLAFGHVYCVVELRHPGSFRGDGFANADPGDLHFLLTYFSFLTLTTVGYGDIVPGTNAVRGLVIVEAIIGQFYIAVLVAELIGKRVSQAFAPPESDAPREKPTS